MNRVRFGKAKDPALALEYKPFEMIVRSHSLARGQRLTSRCCCLLLLTVCFLAGATSRVDGADIPTHSGRFLKPASLSGAIFAKGASTNGPAIFTFQRTARLEGTNTVVALRQYTALDGAIVATETVEYENDQLKRLDLEEKQIDARGSATFERTTGGKTKIRIEYQDGRDSKLKNATETQSGPVLVNDTIPAFILDHWNALTNGATLRFRFVVIPRLETIAFTLSQIGTTENSAGPFVQIEMHPGSRFFQYFVDPIVFSVERDSPHRIVQYVGRTTPKLRRGTKWEDLDALTTFDWKAAKSSK